MKVIKLSIISLFLFSLYGCATTKNSNKEDFLVHQKNALIAAGKSVSFADGYVDGCASGKQIIGSKQYKFTKDQERYRRERDYNLGWESGYYACRDASIKKLQQKVHQEYVPTDNLEEEREREMIWEELRK